MHFRDDSLVNRLTLYAVNTGILTRCGLIVILMHHGNSALIVVPSV